MSAWLRRLFCGLPTVTPADRVADVVVKAMGVVAFCALLGWLINATLYALPRVLGP